MKRRGVTALAFLFFAFLPLSAARAVEEADRLFLVGERATADGIVPVARRALERFVQEFPKDSRLADAVLPAGWPSATTKRRSRPSNARRPFSHLRAGRSR